MTGGPQVGVYSYASSGADPKTQFVFNVGRFRDPQGQVQFAGKNGTDPTVQDWILSDNRVKAVVRDCQILAMDLLKPHPPSDKPRTEWVSFSFFDHHGKWIAPAVAELVAKDLTSKGFKVAVHHLTLRGKP